MVNQNEKRPVIFSENRPTADSPMKTMAQALRFADRMMPADLKRYGFKSEVFASDPETHGGVWFRINYGKRVAS